MLFFGGKMVDAKQRRIDLLQQAQGEIPAVHPRYQATYQNLYQEKEPRTLGIRILVSVLLFLAVLYIKYTNQTIVNVDSSQIISEVQREVWELKRP